MLDIYEYHISPDSLLGGDTRWRISTEAAVKYLALHPSDKGALSKVLSSSEGIIRYVQYTNKPFPEGLARLDDAMDFARYAIVLTSRLPSEYEHKMLVSSGDVEHAVMQYIFWILQKPWKEAELALSGSEHTDFQIEYVNKWLDGDWSRYGDGSFKTGDADAVWQDRVLEAIRVIVKNINELGAQEAEEEGYEWEDVKYRIAVVTGIIRISLLGGRHRDVGRIKQEGQHAILYDGSGEEMHRFSISLSSKEMQNELYEHIYDLVVI